MSDMQIKDSLPSKQECFFVLEMLESRLIDFTYIQPWADGIINEVKLIPDWLFTISTKSATNELLDAIRKYVYSEPFESALLDIEKFRVACYWHRHVRREISWFTFLDITGQYLDAAGGEWDCETPYHYLNITEDSYFTVESEKNTKIAYFKDHDLQPWVVLVTEKFEPFRLCRRIKVNQ